MKQISRPKILSHPALIPLPIVIFFGILASRTLIFQDGYFKMHDDLQIMRQLELEKCLLDRQIPCRWVPDMGYGFGYPLFNFYPPLPYMIGQLFRFAGFTFIATAKLTFALSIILSGITMYYLAKEFFGRAGAVLSSIFYIWAPYHAVEIYVRGAMNEAWALVWFPMILWAGYRLIQSKKRREIIDWLALLALSYSFLMLSHNLMVMIFTPVFAGWVLIHLWRSGNWKRILPLFVASLWALGLSAYFTLPALTENKFTQIKSQLIGYYNYNAHFVYMKQLLFSRFWGYGGSVWLEADDRMSFQIGHLHWILSLLISLYLLFGLVKYFQASKSARKDNALIVRLVKMLRKDQILIITAYILAVGWVSAFLAHPKSVFIWNTIPQLAYMQFPWRFLTIVILSFSFTVGVIPYVFSEWKAKRGIAGKIFLKENKYILIALLIGILVFFNWKYFLPENGKMGPITDEEKLTDAAWDSQQTAHIYDYLPATAVTAPREPMSELVEFMKGGGVVDDAAAGTDWAVARVNITSDNGAVIRLGIFQFPGWITYIDEEEVDNYLAEDEEWGRMYLNVPQGIHSIRAEFTDTPIRKISNWISLFSWVILIVYPFGEKISPFRNSN